MKIWTLSLAAALSLPLTAAPLASVDELPVDKFDEYPAGTVPPAPWARLGASGPGIESSLSRDAESPFVGNRATGKGLVLRDTSTTLGSGTGIEYRFRRPPRDRISLSFDFKSSPPTSGEGADFVCRLDDGDRGPALTFHLAHGHLTVDGPDRRPVELTPLVPDRWYHLMAVITGNRVKISLLDITNAATNPYAVRVKDPRKAFHRELTFAAPEDYRRLAFINRGPDAATGTLTLDNICMAGKVDQSRDAWFPFVRAPKAQMTASPRKVFAYYYIYGSGYDDKDPGLSWYTRTGLNPTLNLKKPRQAAGTELLLRPLPRPPMDPARDRREIRLKAMEEEVRLAMQSGLDGYLADFQAFPNPKNGEAFFTENSFLLMDAAAQIDPGFKILPAVYSSASGGIGQADQGRTPDEYADSPIIRRIARHPAALRTPDGKLVLSMWLTERHTAAWWKKVLARMKENGYPAVLVAQFNSHTHTKDFAGLCYAMAQWGPRHVTDYNWVETARQYTDKVIFPVAAQDVRTRGCGLWEAENTGLLRSLWSQAIEDKADWVFLDTWSDYTETPLAPSTFIGFGPYDLNAYYTQWFKTGTRPEIVRDVLYYCYRRQHTGLNPDQGKKWTFKITAPKNEIELLAFLKTPGELSIDVDGKTYRRQAPVGITSFKVPMPPDRQFVPVFTLRRDGRTVASRRGQYSVLKRIEYPHLIYCYGVIAADETAP